MKRKLLLAALIVAGALGFNANAETDYTSLMSTDWAGLNGASSGVFEPGRENYQGSNYAAGDVVLSQTVETPENGIYEIKFYAVTSCTAERYGGALYGENIAVAFANTGEGNEVTVPMTVINQTGCTLVEDGNIRTLSIEAKQGETITYGLKNIAEGGNWYTIKELSLKMKTVREIYEDQYNEAYKIWENSTENEEGAKDTFKQAVDALGDALDGALAPAQAAATALAAAQTEYLSKSYPVKGSGVKYDFTSKMNMAIDAWTCLQGNGPAQYGFTGATETYGVNAAGEVMYQTITGLANGEYEIRFYAVANAANGGGVAGSNLAYVYANDQTLDIDVIQQNACTPSDYERTFTVMVKDGTIKYGITNKEVAGNWYLCKNVALYMTGAPDLSDYYEAIAENIEKANDLVSSPMNATVLGELQNAIDGTNGYEGSTNTKQLDEMSNTLLAAISAAQTSIEKYEEALAILNAANTLDADGQATYNENETIGEIKAAYDDRSLEEVSSDQIDGSNDALYDAVRAQTSDGADMTLAIVNPSFETNDFTGWTNVNMGIQSNESFGKVGKYYAEAWQPNGARSVEQTISDMPEGTYRLTAKTLARTVTSASIFAGETETPILILADGENYVTEYSVEFAIGEDGDITFGFKAEGDGTGNSWIAVDDFTLTYIKTTSVNVTSTGLATYSSQLPLDLSGIKGGKAYIVTAQADEETITLEECSQVVPAGTGLIIASEEGNVSIPVASEEGEPVEGNYLVATDGTEVPAGNYVLAASKETYENVGFYVLNDAKVIAAGKAYLSADAVPAANPAKALRIVFGDGTATAIEAVATEAEADGALYNVAGQQVGNDYKGIVIKNGKKYLNK